ncbi:metallophosphoesterase family protein [Pseudokineococcus sp. 1T1Z-3]|uniref:metallophosphoesterase family protein n=1 Tax=Pseudokineococcus sp. 1T1Z-3 TaxID=3132745 RepID=UPI0030AF2E1F
MRFLHTADWQLGMTRHYLQPEAQARSAEARLEAVRALGRVAAEHGCAFVVVAGDVFETNQVGRDVVARACEALAEVPVPVLLLPGNHDPLDAGSVLTSERFTRLAPDHVRVLDGTPVEVAGVQVLSAPWRSKRPVEDLAARACADLDDGTGDRRAGLPHVLVAHGAVEAFGASSPDPAVIDLAALERRLDAGQLDAVCLGDRHSTTEVGRTGRVWYAGAPEPTDHDEQDPGNVLVVDLGEPGRTAGAGRDGAGRPPLVVTRVPVGRWRFRRHRVELSREEDVDDLERLLAGLPDKSRTALKLSVVGSLSLAQKARVDTLLDHYGDLLGALQVWERRSDLVVVPDEADLDALALSGFARDAAEGLAVRAQAAVAADLAAGGTGGERGPVPVTADAVAAQDALQLLHRLAATGARSA